MTKKQTMTEMAEKYNKFSHPVSIIKINGKQLNEKFLKKEMVLELTSGYEASYCSFTLSNGFQLKPKNKITIDPELKSMVKLGNKVEIIMGYYGAKNKMLFIGYMDSIYLDYEKEEGIYYTIECLDGKGIMMNSLHSETKKSMKKFSDAVEDVLKKYSSVLKVNARNIDKKDKEIGGTIEQHNESDYDFVVRLAKKINYCFYIQNGEVIFRKMSDFEKDIVFQFDINEYIEEFKIHSSLKNQVSSITVRANSEKSSDKPIQSKAVSFQNKTENGMVKAGNLSKVLTERVSRTVIDHTVLSEGEAKERAEAYLTQLSYGIMKGTIKTPGVPDLTPGSIVKVSGFGQGYERSYFIKKVIHKMLGGNFTTQCEIEVNKV